jgi:enoyl-CoA hydratase/carnithine racemase
MTELGLRLSVDGPVARVVLDRPEVRNAQTPAMWRALADFGTTLPPEVRVVVVSGEGPSFSAGLDRRLIMGETADGEEPQLVGYSRALEICATTRWVEAAEAKELGLANIVVPAEELAGTIKDLTDALLAPLPGAIRETKALLLGATDRPYEEQLKAEREAQERRLKELLAALG